MALALIETYLDSEKKFKHELAEVEPFYIEKGKNIFLLPRKRRMNEIFDNGLRLNNCIKSYFRTKRDIGCPEKIGYSGLIYWCEKDGLFQYRIFPQDSPVLKGGIEFLEKYARGPIYNRSRKKLCKNELEDFLKCHIGEDIAVKDWLKAANIFNLRLPLHFSLKKITRDSLSKQMKKAFLNNEKLEPYPFHENPYFYPIKRRSSVEVALDKIPVDEL